MIHVYPEEEKNEIYAISVEICLMWSSAVTPQVNALWQAGAGSSGQSAVLCAVQPCAAEPKHLYLMNAFSCAFQAAPSTTVLQATTGQF